MAGRRQQHCAGSDRRAKPRRRRWFLWARIGLLVAVVLAVGVAVYGLWPKPQEAPGPYDQKMSLTMGASTPASLSGPPRSR